MSPRQRTYRFADGASALAGLGGPADHHGKVLPRRPGMRRSARCEPAQRRGRVTSAPALSCRYAPWGPVTRRDRLAVTDGPSSGQAALTTDASRSTGQAPGRGLLPAGPCRGPGDSAHGQAAHTLAADITPAGGTAPATSAWRCAARRPPVSSSRRPPKRGWWMRRAGQQRRAEPSPAAGRTSPPPSPTRCWR